MIAVAHLQADEHSAWSAGQASALQHSKTTMPSKAVCIWALGLALGLPAPGTGADLPKAVLRETAFDFGEVIRGRTVDHEFLITNQGTAPLVIHKVAMTPPLRINRLPSQ